MTTYKKDNIDESPIIPVDTAIKLYKEMVDILSYRVKRHINRSMEEQIILGYYDNIKINVHQMLVNIKKESIDYSKLKYITNSSTKLIEDVINNIAPEYIRNGWGLSLYEDKRYTKYIRIRPIEPDKSDS